MNQTPTAHRGTVALRWIFIVGMLAFCAFMAWHTWTVYDLRFQVKDLALTLDTNSQRVRKQQYEYDQVVAALPETQTQLDQVQPESDAMVRWPWNWRRRKRTLTTHRRR